MGNGFPFNHLEGLEDVIKRTGHFVDGGRDKGKGQGRGLGGGWLCVAGRTSPQGMFACRGTPHCWGFQREATRNTEAILGVPKKRHTHQVTFKAV